MAARLFSLSRHLPLSLTSSTPTHIPAQTAIFSVANTSKMTTLRTNNSHQEPPCTPAPWRETFLTHIGDMKSPTFVLATLHPVAGSDAAATNPTPSSLGVVPRARTCIYRGLWACLPPNKHNDCPKNPGIFESDLPVFTTDARMEKAAEILDTAPQSPEHGSTGGSVKGSGGGGPVEACFWAEEHGTQWRIRGTAWLIGPDIDGDQAKGVRDALLSRMRREQKGTGEGDEKDWSWSKELTAHFANLSPMMRGSFRQPPPGTPRAYPKEEEVQTVGQPVDDLNDPVARENFRVVVIIPTEVDQCDLSDPKNPRRWMYYWRGASYKTTHPGGEVVGEWEKVETWP
ncbi:hypothetical protein QBC46DRAFT_260492 [Diplogelasinospora grovesii]|uniref:Pyridoxamine 5'-phosphate oxidase Alr4036 family FMN-binding domain-containing protein n=1 Tax=Diplogelasinospora grovesii TaxID=303347 RepID=A0AAN6N7R0_9PEZI|nr:hypothetical protein QBC46DRAFT_260492 [Diplogelasinospora grovesii]